MSKITKANDIKVPETVIGLIFGQAGTGKTTMALSMPKPLLLDTDGGVHRVQADFRCDTVQVESYQDIIDVLKEDLTSYDSIIIDTFGNLVKFMLDYFTHKDPSLITKGGTLNIKIWGLIKQEFSSLAFKLRQMKKHLLYVAHRTNTSKSSDNDYFEPKSQGKAIEDCIETLDFMGYVEMIGKIRSIEFDPTGRHTGKNSILIDPEIQIPELINPDDNTFMIDYVINPSIERRKKELERKLAIDKSINNGRELIAKSKDPNATLEQFKAMELGSYAKGVLFNELKASTEMTWDNGKFI